MRENERRNDRTSSASRFLSVCFLLAFFLAAGSFLAAVASPDEKDSSFPANFRDIPGITQEEIQALEKVIAKRKTFTYGVMEGSESFYQDDGSLDGYTVTLIELMSKLFGVSFEIKICEWNVLRQGIRDRSIDFSGDFDPDNFNAQRLMVSRAVRERSVKFISRAADLPLSEIASQAPLRVAFLRDSTSGKLAVPHLQKQYGDKLILVPLDDRSEVADMLREKKLDMFIADDAWMGIFLGQTDFVIDTFHPLLYKYVSVLTGNPELAPFISVLNRLLTQKSRQYLYDLHREGRIRFLRKAFVDSLNAV
ncbi:MAG: transporter substrate-binding domain-containing protein, partial [Desulfovibrio sp.]|nr:transporter substrate-binding domain-containing protein [Desulfovibrio sp.]